MSAEDLFRTCLALAWIAQAYLLYRCWKDETFPKHVRIIYSIILLVPILGAYIYCRDRNRTESNLEHLSRTGKKNPWEI